MKNISIQILLKKADYKALRDITERINSIAEGEYKEHLKKIQKNLIISIMNFWNDSETIKTILKGA